MVQILKNRYIYIGIALVLTLFSVIMMFSQELNLGIDMTWGTQTEYTYQWTLDPLTVSTEIEDLAKQFNKDTTIINGTSVYGVSGEKVLVVITGFLSESEEKTLEAHKLVFRDQVTDLLKTKDSTVSVQGYTNIGKTFGDYIKNTAITTLIIAVVAISIYIAYAFYGIATGLSTASFAFLTLVTLLHDLLVAFGLYVFTGIFFSQYQIDVFFITALLTILGYSINDTIVVFDRIRHNLRLYAWKGKELFEIIEMSIDQTFVRSLFTSLTLILVLFTIFIFGPESLKGFMLALIYGTLVGTYSSIFIAAPLLYEMNKKRKLTVIETKVITDDDKVVV